MRKRWQVDWDVVFPLCDVWLIGWLVVFVVVGSLVEAKNPDAWNWLMTVIVSLWLGPFVVWGGTALVAIGWNSRHQWRLPVRRVTEPVLEDLREKS